MKMLFLIPLMACFTCVMAWGATKQVGDFDALKNALDNASNGDVIEMTANIAYPTNGQAEFLNVTKSITLKGKGHTLSGYANKYGNSTLVINDGGTTDIDVKISHLNFENSGSSGRGIITIGHIQKLTVDTCNFHFTGSDCPQALRFWGTQATAAKVIFNGCVIDCDNYYRYGYPLILFNPIDLELNNTTIKSWCAVYCKGPIHEYQSTYGFTNAGTNGSTIKADACTFICENRNNEPSNNFCVFPLEDDGISLTLNNCSYNANSLGTAGERFVNTQYGYEGMRGDEVKVKITGDNSHIYNVKEDAFVFNGFVVGQTEPAISEGTYTRQNVPFSFTIEGGTFTIDPRKVKWYTWSDNKQADKTSNPKKDYSDGLYGSGIITIPDGYGVQEVNQGGVPVYRVTKLSAGGTLNDNVESKGAGNNPNTAFDVTSNTTLNQATTTAGYVNVSNNAALTVGGESNQVLEINNGLDVQGDAQVVVKAGSTLIVGEGGIISEKAANIVVEASNDAAVAFLMSPDITVNTTPEATFKFQSVAKQNGDGTCVWQRFGIPTCDGKTTMSWPDGVKTALYRVNYETGQWELVKPIGYGPYEITDGTSFQCYNMTIDQTTPVEYTFTGKLMGNTNAKLVFDNGWNFFANSYTAPIDIKAFVQEIVSNFGGKVSGTIYLNRYGTDVWDNYNFTDFILGRAATTEILPMQAFVLILREGDDAEGAINYKDDVYTPIWNKLHPKSPMPAKQPAYEQAAYNGVVISASDGVNADELALLEGEGLSDEFDNGFDADKYDNQLSFSIYCTIGSDKMSAYATNDLTDKYVAFDTKNAGEFTLSFKNAIGDDIFLYDEVEEKIVTMKAGDTYTFTAEAGNYPQRFRLNPSDVPSAIEDTDAPTQKITKYLDKDGQIYIRRAGNVYTVQGQTVK